VSTIVTDLSVSFLSHFTGYKNAHAMKGTLVLCTEARSHMRALFCPLSQSHTSWG